MTWLYFAAGFLAFPIVVVLLLLVFQHRVAAPSQIESSQELQDRLRRLLLAGRDREALFIAWFPQQFEIRVCKRNRKSSQDTLWLEVRNSDANRLHYAVVRDALKGNGFELTEAITPARRHPKSFRIAWSQGGPMIVVTASQAIQTVERAISADSPTKCMVAQHSVIYWVRSRVSDPGSPAYEAGYACGQAARGWAVVGLLTLLALLAIWLIGRGAHPG